MAKRAALQWSAKDGGFTFLVGEGRLVISPSADLRGVTLHSTGRHYGTLVEKVQNKVMDDAALLRLAEKADEAADTCRSAYPRNASQRAATEYYEDLRDALLAVGAELEKSITRKISNPRAVLGRGGFRAVSPGRHVTSAPRAWPKLRKNRGNFEVHRKAHGAKAFERWHWGIEPTFQMDVADPRLPAEMELVECGRMYQIKYELPDGGVKTITNTRTSDTYKNSHLCFDANDKWGQLYIISSPSFRQKCKELWDQCRNPVRDLGEVARMSEKGKHNKGFYPKLQVKPLGLLTDLVYGTVKKGDGPSLYHHEVGEETGVLPVLCVAKDGSLWIAGGDYHGSHTAGITN